MSAIDLVPCEFWESERRRVEAGRQCSGCGHLIEPGEIAITITGRFDGLAFQAVSCIGCDPTIDWPGIGT